MGLARAAGAEGDDVLARSIHSQRASSSTCILLSFGMAVKSKLSRLLTTGNLAALMRRSTMRRSRSISLQLDKPGEVADMIDAFGGALPGQLLVLAQEGRQLQRLEMMGEQDLGCFGAHAASPASDDSRRM
jgi:hypothetical protein